MVDNAMQRGQAVEWLVKEKGDVLVVVAALLHGIMGHSLYIVNEEEEWPWISQQQKHVEWGWQGN